LTLDTVISLTTHRHVCLRIMRSYSTRVTHLSFVYCLWTRVYLHRTIWTTVIALMSI